MTELKLREVKKDLLTKEFKVAYYIIDNIQALKNREENKNSTKLKS